MNILTIVGARPQFIKAAMLSKAIQSSDGIEETVIHTGQHYDDEMSQIFFDELKLPAPRFNLGVNGGGHGKMTGRMLERIEDILCKVKPDAALVYGDTNSTLAGALAAAKLHIPVVHVEAGMRSFDRRNPEEVNRVLTDHLSDLLLASTDGAVHNLCKEGIERDQIHLVGDIMYDATRYFRQLAATQSGIMSKLGLSEQKFVLATVHRAENTDNIERLRNIFTALRTIADEMRVVVPLHPRTVSVLDRFSIDLRHFSALSIIPPLGFLDMIRLEASAALIVTDSGGVQKEAFFHKVPCVTVRQSTEWTELVDAKWNRLASPDDVATMVTAMRNAIGTQGNDFSPYGNGNTASHIVKVLKDIPAFQ